MSETINASTEVPVDILADLLGIGSRRIQQLSKEGVEGRITKGRYNLFRFVFSYIQHVKESAKTDSDSGAKSYELELLRWRSANERLKYFRETNQVIPADEAIKLFQNIINSAKLKLLDISAQCERSDSSFTHTQLDLIDGIIREVLTELADGEKRASQNIKAFEEEGEEYLSTTEEDDFV
ncbi:hypothetical protein [Piscirickettsia litoralis]|uniref:DNA-binding protein n=1 Tax=Piscirickettsia litoralis TaxID=1891921 RepID=A0ABX2ZZB3_9GAMM|nr:hypothetical protein [Piscirickettsia litoralis]ODN41568.1 hypothetical protein BGC07_15790 [Piscirickettsia litoralis]